ncbi:MAG TPA: formyltransferase [Thermoanaerobaculia bacterium]|jgi:methionyl-tRNA formyltransferase|nr:formyltransferase [Thermoanaerobaculia bacterium]
MTRIAVFAYSDTGYECLKFLFERGRDVAVVVTHADDPDEMRWYGSVAELARNRGIEPLIVEDPRDPAALATIEAAKPELLFSFYYRGILPDTLLSLPRLGAFNMHGSLLPKFRGRAPVNWAVLKGETVTGATLHAMTARPDAGDIVDQEQVSIGPDDTAGEVQSRVTAAAVKILERRLEELENGTAPSRPQDESQATTFGRRRPEDGKIAWTRTAQEVHDLVRAVTHPFPGAFTDIFGGKTYLWRTRLPQLGAHDNFPGQIRSERGRLYVACEDDRYIEVLRIQKEGGEEMDGADFVAGPKAR